MDGGRGQDQTKRRNACSLTRPFTYLRTVHRYDVYDAVDEEEPEFTFSDDEAEASYMREKAQTATRPTVTTQVRGQEELSYQCHAAQ
jgi:hypothetical protein